MEKTNELALVEGVTALQVFSTEGGLDPIIEEAKVFVASFEHDLSTGVGRKRTASLAAKVAKLKTTLDGMGKDLVSDWKEKAKKVDASRRAMREALDELKAEARKPLTEWEEEQERLKQEEAERLAAERLAAEIESAHEIGLLMNEKFDRDAADAAAEAERQRQEEERRRAQEQAEREERLKQEAADQARAEAERKAQEENDRIERERRDALRREEEARQRAEQAERDRIAAEERAKAQAEQAEREKAEAEERARQQEIQRQQAEQDRIRREQEQREANNRHVSGIRRQAKESLMGLGMDEAMAKRIVLAIHSGNIANVKITY